MTLMDAQPTTLAEIPYVVRAGCTSFKTYLTYDGFKLADGEFLAALEAVADAGGLALVHAENDAIVTRLKARFLREGHLSRAGIQGPGRAGGRRGRRAGAGAGRSCRLPAVCRSRLHRPGGGCGGARAWPGADTPTGRPARSTCC